RLDRAASLEAAHLGDRAERARIVATLADLQVRVAAPAREDPRGGLVVEPRRERLLGEARERRKARGGGRRELQLVQPDERVHLGDLLGELPPALLDHAPRRDHPVHTTALL